MFRIVPLPEGPALHSTVRQDCQHKQPNRLIIARSGCLSLRRDTWRHGSRTQEPPSLRNWQATASAPPSAQHRRQAAVYCCELGGNHCPSDRVRRHRSIDRGRRKAGVRSEGVGGISCVRSRIADACVEYAWQHGNRWATAHVSQRQWSVAQCAREAIWSCPNNDWVYRERIHYSKRGDGGTSGSGA